jgi:prepilin-type N-terminal cleavage/methylation domain-containing protein
MKVPSPAPTRSAGFTLVEIAIVLVIASLILAAGIGISVAVVDNVRAKTTRQNMESIKLGLQSFIARNGRLPCPAVEATAPSNAAYGIEASTPGTCTGTVDLPGATGIDAAKRGVVPWKTLGLTLESATDGWSNQFTYMVTVTATGKTFDTVAGMRGSLYVHSAAPVAAGLPGTGNQINACSTTADDNTCNKAAVVIVISHGRNIFGAYTTAGVRAPTSSDAGEAENTDDDRFVVSAEPSTSFDDLVLPLAPDDFLASLAAQGAIKGERALLLERARQVVIQMIGEVAPTREDSGSGTGSCSGNACRYVMPSPTGLTTYTFEAGRFNTSCDAPYNTTGAATGVVSDVTGDAAQVLDPWGRVFKFGQATAYINSSESCKTPVAVISVGPDGALGGGDDYVYYSPMAEWKEVLGKVGW